MTTPARTLSRPTPGCDTDDEFARIVAELTRRGFLAGGLGSAALLGLTACGSNGSGGKPQSGSAAAGWSFTDDLGRTIHLPNRPARVVSTDDLVSVALLEAGLTVSASPLLPDGLFPSLGLPTGGIASIANAANEFNVEKVTATRPDVIVDFIQDGKPAVTTATAKLQAVAPVVALQVNNAGVQQIIESARRFAAAAAGRSDGTGAPDAAAKTDYTAALTALRQSVQANPGLRVAFVLPVPKQLSISRMRNTPYMHTLADAGVTFVADHATDRDYFQAISWENAPTLPVDVLIPAVTVNDPSPVWNRMPAVGAGQVFPGNPQRWSGYFYSNYATVLAELAAFLRTARIVGPH